jgi:hypothetical protein
MQTKQVAIVFFGRKTLAGSIVPSDHANDDGWKFVDLTKILTDRVPNEQLYPGEDGFNAMTALAVFEQFAYPDSVCAFAHEFDDSPCEVIAVHCMTGAHRASTWSYTTADVLNAMVDADGNKRFNVQVFPLLRYTRHDTIRNQVSHAIDWTNRDTTIVLGGPDKPRSELFGYEAVAQRQAAEDNFNAIHDWVQDYNSEKILAQADAARTKDRGRGDGAARTKDRGRGVSRTKDRVVGFLAQRIVVIMVVVLLHRSSSIVIDAVNLVCVDHVLAPRIVQGLRVDHLQVVAHHQQLIVNNTVMMNMPTIAMTMM